MTNQYRKKLVELAKEVFELNKPIITSQERAKIDAKWNREQFLSKLNYLLGYILALEETK